MMLSFWKIFISLLEYSTISYSLNFNRNVTGVSFSPYVRSVNEQGPNNRDWTTYTLEDVKTMLQVVSGKFSKITTSNVGAHAAGVDLYEPNVTYYKSFSQVFVAEAAAILNLEAKYKLTLVIGVWVFKNPNQMDSEFQVALEAASKANSIYPGTVCGLVLSKSRITTDKDYAAVALSQLQKWRKQATEQNLSLGTRQNCKEMKIFMSDEQQSNGLKNLTKEIVKLSDFLICIIDSSQNHLGPSARFDQVARDFLRLQKEIKLINLEIEITLRTGVSAGASTTPEINDLKEYWETVNNWAAKSNISVWMHEAIDNPWKSEISAHRGWWRLTSNDKVGNFEGYSEKILNNNLLASFNGSNEKKKYAKNGKILSSLKGNYNNNDTIGLWAYVGISAGVLFVVAFVAHVVISHKRFRQLRDVLSAKEVKQFKYGSEGGGGGGGNDTFENEHCNKPYDDSYEISKDSLTILWDSLLGSGEFGVVCKALVESADGDIEVALKMAKDCCPKPQVKSILNEIKILIHLGYHPNLVSIKGAYTAEISKGVVYLATELCGHGSLHQYLKSSQENTMNEIDDDIRCSFQDNEYDDQVDFPEMVRWSYQIACGMEYLVEKHVVHADLATRNVLLSSENKIAKITDFGLSRRLYDYKNYVKKQQEPLPWRWMAIESLKKLEFNSQSDVWSYGVTLWEIFSMGDSPYPGLSWSPDYVSVLEYGLRMKCPTYACPAIYSIMLACWEKEPSNRPNFTQLKLKFLKILEDLKIVLHEAQAFLEPSHHESIYIA